MTAALSANRQYVKYRSATHKWYRAYLRDGSIGQAGRVSRKWFATATFAMHYRTRVLARYERLCAAVKGEMV